MSEYLGSAVVGGEIRFLSVSSVEKFDPRSGGCQRKWWYRYIGKVKDAPSKSKDAGIALHDELATYLQTGAKALSSLALSGLHMVPDPGPDLLVEQSIGGIKNPLLTADGIPFVGKIDCAHDRGTNKGTDDINDTNDPPGTIELIDWKWKGDGTRLEFFMQPGELINTVQMSGYGVFAARAFPQHTHVRLSHGYFPAKGRKPFKASKLHVINDCERSWKYVEGLARSMRVVARETSPERVQGNPNACGAYGGCVNREYCSTYKAINEQRSLVSLYGEQKENIVMGLLQNLPPALQPMQQLSLPLPSPTMQAQLLAEETAQRQQAAQTSVGILPGFADAWRAIEQSGRGYPALGGAAAVMRAALVGQSLGMGASLQGAGDLGTIPPLHDPQDIIRLGGELVRAQPVAQTQAVAPTAQPAPFVQHVQHYAPPMSILPPDAPASNPALAAKPLESVTTAPVMQWAGPNLAPPPMTPPPAPKKRGRPKASSPASVAVQQPVMAPPPTDVTPVAQATDAGDDLEVFVDAIPNCNFVSLHPYIDTICAALCAKFIPPGGLADVRCAPKDGPLGFGGWRGAISAIVREHPPTSGTYYLDTRGNELALEVAEAMRTHCEKVGALYVRGVR